MKLALVAFLVSVLSVSAVVAQADDVNIIPKPISVRRGAGTFTIDAQTRIVAKSEDRQLAKLLRDVIASAIGIELKITSRPDKTASNIVLVGPDDALSPRDSYALSIGTDRAQLSAPSPSG